MRLEKAVEDISKKAEESKQEANKQTASVVQAVMEHSQKLAQANQEFQQRQQQQQLIFGMHMMVMMKSLYSAAHSRCCKKEKNEGVHCFSGPPCCLRQYSKRETRNFGDTCKK